MKKLTSDPTLSVIQELPHEAQIKEEISGDKSASIGLRQYWHYCPECKGWIEGVADESRVLLAITQRTMIL